MIEKSIVFRLITVEEASIVHGGSNNSTPQFGFTSTSGTTTGKIINADGKGKDVTIYETNNTSNKQNDEVPYLEYSLTPFSKS